MCNHYVESVLMNLGDIKNVFHLFLRFLELITIELLNISIAIRKTAGYNISVYVPAALHWYVGDNKNPQRRICRQTLI